MIDFILHVLVLSGIILGGILIALEIKNRSEEKYYQEMARRQEGKPTAEEIYSYEEMSDEVSPQEWAEMTEQEYYHPENEDEEITIIMHTKEYNDAFRQFEKSLKEWEKDPKNKKLKRKMFEAYTKRGKLILKEDYKTTEDEIADLIGAYRNEEADEDYGWQEDEDRPWSL